LRNVAGLSEVSSKEVLGIELPEEDDAADIELSEED